MKKSEEEDAMRLAKLLPKTKMYQFNTSCIGHVLLQKPGNS